DPPLQRQCVKTMDILTSLHDQGIQTGVASRTGEVDGEIYPWSKVPYFKKQTVDSSFSEMTFFDAEHRNIKDVIRLGVQCVLVPKRVTMRLVVEEILQFSQGAK
uniref:Uncharacterized protein n=1 Tax=Oncorhynchus mykiss TaxID=8022 RepID=A0A8C7NDB8_ONCMY